MNGYSPNFSSKINTIHCVFSCHSKSGGSIRTGILWLYMLWSGYRQTNESTTVLHNEHEFHETCHSVTFYFMKIKTPNDAVTPQCQSQFTPKMKANAVSRLLSYLVWIDQYNECNGLTSFMEFMVCVSGLVQPSVRTVLCSIPVCQMKVISIHRHH